MESDNIPKLSELCQAAIIKMLEDISEAATNTSGSQSIIANAAKSSSIRNRLIHDMCRVLPDHLLGVFLFSADFLIIFNIAFPKNQ